MRSTSFFLLALFLSTFLLPETASAACSVPSGAHTSATCSAATGFFSSVCDTLNGEVKLGDHVQSTSTASVCPTNGECCRKVFADSAACSVAGGDAQTFCLPGVPPLGIISGGVSATGYCCPISTATTTTTTSTTTTAATAATTSAAAATGFAYQPLEDIPGSTRAEIKTFPGYIQGIYKFGIWTVGLAALFMLSVGGFIYLSSGGNTATIGKAKTYIWDALIGLVLALLAYLILYVINPDLVNVNLGSFSKVGGSVPATIDSVAELPPSVQANVYPGNVALNELNKNGIYAKSSGVCAGEIGCVNYVAPNIGCSTQKLNKCTSLEGIPQHAVFGLINLKAMASAWWAKKIGVPGTKCDFMVTGGTEVGHKSHGPGKAAVDVSEVQCLGEFLASEVNSVGTKGIKKICTRGGTKDADGNAKAIPTGLSSYIVNAKLACEYQEESPHYHIQF